MSPTSARCSGNQSGSRDNLLLFYVVIRPVQRQSLNSIGYFIKNNTERMLSKMVSSYDC